MIVTALLFALLLVATATDLASRKIYNWTTYTGIVAAIALNAVGSVLEERSDQAEAWQKLTGWVGLKDCLTGLAVCGAVMLVCYVLFHVGGGDVKLMAMLGAMLGLERGVEALLWTFVLGACSGLVLLIWRVGALTLLSRAGRYLLSAARLGAATPVAPQDRAPLQTPLFLAPCALAATIIVHFDLLSSII